MECCADCFGDRGLRRNIFPLRAILTGDCAYCDSKNVLVLNPRQLSDYFELLISAYRSDSGGKRLVEWFREDWGMFDHPKMDNSRATDLLVKILDDEDIVRQSFVPAEVVARTDRLGEWENLRNELMYQNRFFPDAKLDLGRLELLLSPLTLSPDEVPTRWYRARIQIGDVAFTVGEMGAPPKKIASHGRANPAGIPYLYVGSTQVSAISEIRPHTGETACVIDYTTPANLKLVDLRSPRKMVSPFMLVDAEDVERMRNDLPFLERLGEELTRPVLPHAAAIDYTPSQYLCEFIKKCGYDGVLYRSSVLQDGINLALFDPIRAKAGTVAQYYVNRVSIDAKPA